MCVKSYTSRKLVSSLWLCSTFSMLLLIHRSEIGAETASYFLLVWQMNYNLDAMSSVLTLRGSWSMKISSIWDLLWRAIIFVRPSKSTSGIPKNTVPSSCQNQVINKVTIIIIKVSAVRKRMWRSVTWTQCLKFPERKLGIRCDYYAWATFENRTLQ